MQETWRRGDRVSRTHGGGALESARWQILHVPQIGLGTRPSFVVPGGPNRADPFRDWCLREAVEGICTDGQSVPGGWPITLCS